MIHYKFPEEKDYAIFYAKRMHCSNVVSILERGEVLSVDEARILSAFFWSIVDKPIDDENNDVELEWVEGAEFWNEKLLQTWTGHLEHKGFIKAWKDELDKQ